MNEPEAPPPSPSDRGLRISSRVRLPLDEIEISAVRARGPGGQNVNKVATAIQLRFDVVASSLPERYKSRLLALRDRRVTRDGTIVIKAQAGRSQKSNLDAALERLRRLVASVAEVPKARRPTRPTRGAKERRLREKKQRGRVKDLRGRVDGDE